LKTKDQKDLSSFSCDLLDKYINKMALLLMIRDSSQEKNVELYANRCLVKVRHWLKKYQEYDKARYTRLEVVRQTFDLLFKIKNHNEKSKTQSISKFFKEYNLIEKSNSFKDSLSRLALAEHSKNDGWIRSEVDRLLRYDFIELYFDFPSTLDRNWSKDLEDLFFHYFERWSKNENELVKHFIFLFSLGQEHEERYKNLRMNLDIAWSLADIRRYVKSVNFGQRYPGFWYRILNRRSNELEVDFFLSTLHDEDRMRSLGMNELWILLEKIPYQEKKKNILVERLFEIWKSKSAYGRYLVLKFLEDKQIKFEFEKKDATFKRALFQIKKETFTAVHSEGKAELLMIYELITLGDYQEQFLEQLLWL
jgi:hypothetical protein